MKISKQKLQSLIKESVLNEMSQSRPRKLKIKQLGVPHQLDGGPGYNGDMALVNAAIKILDQFGQPIDRDLIDAQTNQEITRYYEDNPHYNPRWSGRPAEIYNRHVLPPFGDAIAKRLESRIRDLGNFQNPSFVSNLLYNDGIINNWDEGLRSQGLRGPSLVAARNASVEGIIKLAAARSSLLMQARDALTSHYANEFRRNPNGYRDARIADWLIELQEISGQYNVPLFLPL